MVSFKRSVTEPPAPASTPKAVTDEDPRLITPAFTLGDLTLPAVTKGALQDFLAHRQHEDLIFNQWGLATTHKRQRQTAINLYGLPGTGKTMAAHAIAHALGKQLVIVNYAELESKYVGETSKNITKLFEQARQHGAIILFDEADAVLSRRVTDMSSATDVSVNQTRSVLLTLMNDYDGLIIFTTNFIENYDPAFMRRILSHINFILPDHACRIVLWKQYIPTNLPHSVDMEELASISDGLSGSDISNCVMKAALQAARRGEKEVDFAYFQSAVNEVISSKSANAGIKTVITTREVDNEIAKQLAQRNDIEETES